MWSMLFGELNFGMTDYIMLYVALPIVMISNVCQAETGKRLEVAIKSAVLYLGGFAAGWIGMRCGLDESKSMLLGGLIVVAFMFGLWSARRKPEGGAPDEGQRSA